MKKRLYSLVLLSSSIVLLTGCNPKETIESLIKGDSGYHDIYHTEEDKTPIDNEFSIGEDKPHVIENEYGVVSYHIYDGDKYYTVRENDPVYNKYEPDEEISLVELTDADYENMGFSSEYYLAYNIMASQYVRVILPSKYYYYVTGSSIYAPDGQIRVDLYDGKVGSSLDAGDSITYDKSTKYTKNGGKKSHIIVREFDNGYTLRVEVNSNSKDWSMVVNQVITMVDEFELPIVKVTEYSLESSHLDVYEQSIYLTDDYYRLAKFEDGSLSITNSAFNMEDNIKAAKNWVITRQCSSHDGTCYENKSDNAYIVWSDTGYSAAVFRNNKDFSFVLYGEGDEALLNIMEIIKHEAQ